MNQILSRIEATLRKYRMLTPGERILIACSGGADSVALFHLLRELAPRFGIRLGLIHFDHALRQGSVRDFEFVRRLARRCRVSFYGERRKRSRRRILEKNLSPEEAARNARYEYFTRTAKRAHIRKIALGHHRDDQAETVLMRIVQGTGPRGLQGIRPVLESRGVTFIRPLIELGRAEIRSFLKEHSIVHREDPTNRSARFLRNRIRRDLLPLLEKEFNPRIRESLAHLAESTAGELTGLEDWVREKGKGFIRSRRNGTIWLDREPLLLLPAPLQFRLFDQFLRLLDPESGLDFKSWERLEEGLRKGRHRASLARNLDLRLTAKKLFIRKNDTL